MAAYAALVSLMNLIEQIQCNPRPPITLDKEQSQSLTERIAFFQEFLEVYNSHYANQEMERQRDSIADAAYAAEDFIESCVFNGILGRSTSHDGQNFISLRDFVEGCSCGCSNNLKEKISCIHLYLGLQKLLEQLNFLKKEGLSTSRGFSNSLQSDIAHQLLDQVTTEDEAKISSSHLNRALQKLIEHMDILKKEVLEIKDRIGTQDQLQSITTPPVVSTSSSSMKEKTMVGHDDVLHEILDKLTRQPSGRQILSISGMGGIGKTTLARNIYRKQHIVEHFDICSWVTISQEYNIREILVEVLCQTHQGSKESLSEMTDTGLKEKLYKSLCGRRYLIIMDDIWNHEVWDKLKFLFPDNNNGSRIVITTRLSKLAQDLSGSYCVKVDFLNQDKSWSLFCKTVFGEDDCPPELKHIGMMIVKNCKGLPLSIVVIGGILAKFKYAREYWEYVAENVSSNLNLDENEGCLNILHTSYKQLPVHLKACFLYMGIIPENGKIRVSELIKVWVAEGFLKPMRDKSLEESAEEYLKDLIDRNLVMVNELGSSGRVKYCNIHDLLRDLCLRQAQKEKFLCLASKNCLDTSHEGINTKRRIAIRESTSMVKTLCSLKSEFATRSLICYSVDDSSLVKKFRLLRVLKKSQHRESVYSMFKLEDLFELVNLRYLGIHSLCLPFSNPSSISLWNLQTLITPDYRRNCVVPLEILNMHHLRHVKFGSPHVFDPPEFSQTDGQNDIVLENLQTLVEIKNFKCNEEMVKRIPNVRKLAIHYTHCKEGLASDHCLNNLVLLHKLESLRCQFDSERGPCRDDLLHNLIFPSSLKKLTLYGTFLYWEDINTKIGSLPFLQVLKLKSGSVIGPEWETIEGKFPNLKYLLIDYCTDLECWIAESIHFPRLEHLVLKELPKLKEIPSGVGEIPTLESIHLEDCSDSVIISTKKILDEQEDLGNEGLHVRVFLGPHNDQHLKSLASHNFLVQTYKFNIRAQFLALKAAFTFVNSTA